MPTPFTFTAPPPPPPLPPPPRTLLLTVGSTSFTPLVTSLLSTQVLTTLSSLGIESVIAQIGNSDLPSSSKPGSTSGEGQGWVVGSNRLVLQGKELDVDVLRFSNDLERKVGGSDWVVAHAGAGSILSFIRPVPINSDTRTTSRTENIHRKLFLIPNSTLMDLHQSDLADEFERYDWVEVVRELENLNTAFKIYLNSSSQTSKNVSRSTPIPPFDPFKIRTILDQVVGYV